MVCGIDFSTRTVDLVLLNDDGPGAIWKRLDIQDDRGPLFAARNVRRELPGRSWWEDNGVHLVGLEDPYSPRLGTAKTLGYIAGALAACLPPDVTIVQTAPNEWLRVFTGEKTLPKSSLARKSLAKHTAWSRCDGVGFGEWAADAYDAYGIAYAVRYLCEKAVG